jgi:hypothetical protein
MELPRIWRSPYSDFCADSHDTNDETVTANAVYTDAELARIAASGFNAIWVHGELHHMAKSSVFPEFGANAKLHIQNMRALIKRAGKHGLKVYVYMQPPLGLAEDDPFWKAHPQIAGTPMQWQRKDGKRCTYLSTCTSTPEVKKYLYESTKRVFKEMTGLAGALLITASEYPQHCYRPYPYAHYLEQAQGKNPDGAGQGIEVDEQGVNGQMPPLGCPRCAKRHPSDVITEIIQLVQDGAKASNPDAQVVAWNWSWSHQEKDPSPTIINKLPPGVILMADFERGDQKEILGKVRTIDEYSLSFAGPSKRFMGCYKIAQKQKRQMITKLQLGTTHELATVPNLPLIGNLHEKAKQMRKLKISGFMGCWNFGNMATANPAAFNEFLNAEKLAPRAAALKQFAQKYFPGCEPEPVRAAWEKFAEAMNNYPFSIPFIYMSPLNYTLSYPLKPGKLKGDTAGRSWHDDKRGDDLSACLDKPYTVDEVIRGLNLLTKSWKEGAQLLEQGLKSSDSETARQERDNAWVCYHIWRSGWNTFRAYKLRLKWSDDKLPAYQKIIADELKNLQQVLPIIEADNRFGWHSEPQAYLYTADGIKKKIKLLEKQLKS